MVLQSMRQPQIGELRQGSVNVLPASNPTGEATEALRFRSLFLNFPARCPCKILHIHAESVEGDTLSL